MVGTLRKLNRIIVISITERARVDRQEVQEGEPLSGRFVVSDAIVHQRSVQRGRLPCADLGRQQ